MNLSPTQYRALFASRHLYYEQEKKRLARKIHDEVSQKLTILGFEISLLGMDLPARRAGRWGRKLKEMACTLNELCQTVREITNELRPKVLDEFGLIAALQWYAKCLEKEMVFQVVCPVEEISMPPALSSELFAACQEVISGFRAGGATSVVLEIAPGLGLLQIRLRCMEKNPQSREGRRHRSLASLSLQERVQRLGGIVRIKRAPRKETSINICIPLLATGKRAPAHGKS